jgi:hypothetical protein
VIESPDYLERVNGVIQTSSFQSPTETRSNAEDSHRADGDKNERGGASIPSFAAFTSVIDLPAMTAEETAQAVPYQARSLVAAADVDVTIDWTLIRPV